MSRGDQPVGRPRKYDWVLQALDDGELYTPASIADLAMALGAARRSPGDDPDLIRTRVRITMGRYGVNNAFPREGDGLLPRKGQAPTPAWLGERWKAKLYQDQIKPRPAVKAVVSASSAEDPNPDKQAKREGT